MLSGTNHDPCINFEPSPLVVQLIKLEFEDSDQITPL
jgi:hypothetical protein